MTAVYADASVYLLYQSRQGETCQHERVYATRDMAERNLNGMLREEYKNYLKRHIARIPSTLTDPTPMGFFEFAEMEHGWAIEELAAVVQVVES